MKSQKKIFSTLILFVFITSVNAQSIERVVFSSVASSNDNFQPIVGMPYGAYLSNNSGSLTVSAEYGKSTFKETALSSVDIKDNDRTVLVYPNPVSDQVFIEFEQFHHTSFYIRLLDLNGKELLYHKALQNLETIDLTQHAVGSYLLIIENNETGTQSFKIIKSK